MLSFGTFLLLCPLLWTSAAAYTARGGAHDATHQQPHSPYTAQGPEQPRACALDPALVDEINSYQGAVDQIITYVVNGEYKGLAYETLAELVDTFGSRLTGSTALEDTIDWMLQKSIAEGLENVHSENVTVPVWARNEESATLVSPRQKELKILGLGRSVGTPPEGITAPVLVVKDFQELEDNAAQAAGKIVVYNQEYVSYGATVQYRSEGASRAAEVGAVAALICSVTDFSIYSPHTGSSSYSNESIAIPGASITVEDAAMLQRMQDRGEDVQVKLVMSAQTLPDALSRNTVVELQGALQPAQVVLVSGHIDSWDVGQGAMDDGGGVVISWLAPVLLKRMALRPRRTVRAVFWTSEEQGGVGGEAYYTSHQSEHRQFQLIMESDGGTFNPLGLGFSGTPEAQCVMEAVLNLTALINTTQLVGGGGGTDINFWFNDGVPLGSLHNDNSKYFWFHHSDGDTMSVYEPAMLDRCLALWTAVSYVVADMSYNLPHSNTTSGNPLFIE